MLNLVGKELKHLKEKDISNASDIQHLDVSSNQLTSGIEFKPFNRLVTLVIDDNQLSSLNEFPSFKML